MTKILAMVLAGGRGKRMDILCHMRPKPALSFAGGFRVIDFSLSNCIHSGIRNIAVLTDYQRTRMAEYLNRWRQANAGMLNFAILEPEKGSYKGTADAAYQNLDYLRKCDAEAVLVLAGDHIYKMDYRRLIDFHEKARADVTVGVVTVPIEQMYRFGSLRVNSDFQVTDFVEKSRNPESTLASMGIYVFNKKVLIERLIEDAARPDSPHDFGYAIMPEMVRHDRVFAYQFQGYWQDIGTKDAYYEANMELVGPQPSFSLDSQWHILTEEPDLALMQKVNQGSIQNSLISPGCVIKGRVENSILSPGVRVGEKAVVRNSILMSDVSVGYHSVVDRCILDEGVDISQYCYIGFGNGIFATEQDITVVGKGVAVPKCTAVGRNCTIMPHVEQVDFHGNIVPSGTTLSPRLATGVAGKKG
ncbi:MAG: glucose-1-phosphate adenylyltransferase family protein [Dehalococcoidales bacterium]|nr:glucose-1-phosphate adenylyltransferase family protein [Dehalococcoidales bacterium]